MRNTYKISILHIILISLTSIGLKNHVMIISPILEAAKRDGWMSVLLAGIFLFPWILWIIYIQKKSKLKPMKVWLTEKIGKIGANIILYSIVIFSYFLAAFTLRETILWMTSTFLENTPIPFLLIIYIIVCFIKKRNFMCMCKLLVLPLWQELNKSIKM
ncbi:GerAB/ArcD/ProY family transporter [Ureibacillus thermophilus]|uniref:GerAB/ArcD/ProY family transporter n=1 Tax=Ureibacillus thermophilus TaxID=367743 RepID=UPI00361B29D5